MAEIYDNHAKTGGFRVSMCGGAKELEQMSRDGSQYSLTTAILPSLGARSNRRVQLRNFIISPYDRRYRFTRISSITTTYSSVIVFMICMFVRIKLSYRLNLPISPYPLMNRCYRFTWVQLLFCISLCVHIHNSLAYWLLWSLLMLLQSCCIFK